jgi:hypothetical protein
MQDSHIERPKSYDKEEREEGLRLHSDCVDKVREGIVMPKV